MLTHETLRLWAYIVGCLCGGWTAGAIAWTLRGDREAKRIASLRKRLEEAEKAVLFLVGGDPAEAERFTALAKEEK